MKKSHRMFFIIVLFCLIAAYGAERKVCITKSGKRYHASDCKTLKSEVEYVSIEEAKAMGLTPCKVCHPGN